MHGVKSFLVGVHHGGCQTVDNCGVSENTGETFILSKQLGGDYSRSTSGSPRTTSPSSSTSGSPHRNQGTYCVGGIEDWTYAQLVANCRARNGEIIPRLVDVLEYGLTRTDLVVWLDMKVENAVVLSSQIIGQLNERLVQCQPGQAPPRREALPLPGKPAGHRAGLIGLPSDDIIDEYTTALAAGQLAPGQRCLCEDNVDAAVSVPCAAGIPPLHPGAARGRRAEPQSRGKFFGYWTINDPATMNAFLRPAGRTEFSRTTWGLLNVQSGDRRRPLHPLPLGVAP